MNKGGLFLLCLFLILTLGQAETGLAAPLVPICQIQGVGFTSAWEGSSVQVQGVVSADFDDTSTKGFYMQDANCDKNPATSDGIFVYLGERIDIVSVGDLVLASGTVQEYYGLTELKATSSSVSTISQGNPLPAAHELYPSFDKDQARAYFESQLRPPT